MKIKSVNTNNNYDTNCRVNSVSVQTPRLNNQPAKDSVSFSGLKSGVSGMFEKMGTNFFIQFLVVDTLSMIVPRVLIGLSRDKEKTGKINYKAGAEEAGRECLSGPSMGIIPMAILATVSHFAPAAHMHGETLNAVTQSMNKVVDKFTDTAGFDKKETLNKKLASELFDNAFVESDTFKLDETARADFKKQFVEKLIAEPAKDNKANKKLAEEFDELVELMHNQNKSKVSMDTELVSISKDKGFKLEINAKHLFEDFKIYSNDVVAKFVKKDFTKEVIEKCKENGEKFIHDISQKRANLRIGAAVTSFAAVGTFLLYLPKLYQVSKKSPAQRSVDLVNGTATKKGGANENK